MLQFSPTVYSITTRLTSRLLWRLHTSLMSKAATVTNVSVNKLQEAVSNIMTNDLQHGSFNQLKTKLRANLDTKSLISSKIKDAEDIHDLLQVIKEPLLTQTEIINALHTITLWVNEHNNHESDVAESNDNVQRKKHNVSPVDLSKYHDLSTVQMIKEVKALAVEGKRNVQLLNYFFQNIVTYSQELTPKACSSLMFSMSKISYSDERLLKKISTDLISHLTNSSVTIPAAVLVSIIKSMTVIRYRNITFLYYTCCDIIKSKHNAKYAYYHIANIFLSFAILGYQSESLDRILELYGPELSCTTLGHSNWLDVVWSLVVLQRVEQSQITSVLNTNFIQKLILYDTKKLLSYRLKLLNIAAYRRYVLKDYDGPPIVPTLVPDTVLKQSKQKLLYVRALEDTLKEFLPSATHYKMSVDTQMGFFVDAELYMDSDMTSVVHSEDVKEGIFKIGLLLLDYYDLCLGSKYKLGIIELYIQLLTSRNYQVVCVPYQNFSPQDKVEKRISYLKRQIWAKLNELTE